MYPRARSQVVARIRIFPMGARPDESPWFLEYGARAVALGPILSLAERVGSPVYAQAIPAAVMNRIAISTDCFRLQFKTTFARGQSGPPANLPTLNLLTAPKYIADQFGIHNVEIWAPHFEDLSMDYCREIKS